MTTHDAPKDRYLVEHRPHEGAPWRHPTTRMQDSVFETLEEARFAACQCDHGFTRISCWTRYAVEYQPFTKELVSRCEEADRAADEAIERLCRAVLDGHPDDRRPVDMESVSRSPEPSR